MKKEPPSRENFGPFLGGGGAGQIFTQRFYIYHRPPSSVVSLQRLGGIYLSSSFNVFYFKIYGYTFSTLAETSDSNRDASSTTPFEGWAFTSC